MAALISVFTVSEYSRRDEALVHRAVCLFTPELSLVCAYPQRDG